MYIPSWLEDSDFSLYKSFNDLSQTKPGKTRTTEKGSDDLLNGKSKRQRKRLPNMDNKQQVSSTHSLSDDAGYRSSRKQMMSSKPSQSDSNLSTSSSSKWDEFENMNLIPSVPERRSIKTTPRYPKIKRAREKRKLEPTPMICVNDDEFVTNNNFFNDEYEEIAFPEDDIYGSTSNRDQRRYSPPPVEFVSITQSKPLHSPLLIPDTHHGYSHISPSSLSSDFVPMVMRTLGIRTPSPGSFLNRDGQWSNEDFVDNLYHEFMSLNKAARREIMRLDLGGTPSPEPFITLDNGKRVRVPKNESSSNTSTDLYEKSYNTCYSPTLSTIEEQSGVGSPREESANSLKTLSLSNSDLVQSYSQLSVTAAKSWNNIDFDDDF